MYKKARLAESFIRRPMYIGKIEGHLLAAAEGDRERESKLITRIGELRADFPSRAEFRSWAEEDPAVLELLGKAVAFLRSVGRTVDFSNPDPALWISARGGGRRVLSS